MADDKPLNDIEVWDRMHAALEALGDAPGATTAGDTAMASARRALVLLQMGVLKASEPDAVKGQAET